MQNIEYKAELRDLALARTIAQSMGALHAETMQQTDTYYRVPDARLKKREIRFIEHANHQQQLAGSDFTVEFIHYTRADQARPRSSDFVIYSPEQARERFGQAELPVWLTVRKIRELWLHHGVRIHLDRVDGVGDCIEFEAPVVGTRTAAQCQALVQQLITTFRPAMGEPIARGYADLVAEK